MAITTTCDEKNRTVIRLDGRFDFSCHQDFRLAYENDPGKTFILDMAKVEYMDSSALGMLLIMREQVQVDDSHPIEIVNCRPEVRKVLEIANYGQLFEIR